MRIKAWHWGASLGVALLVMAVSDVPSGQAAETSSNREAWLGVYSQTLTSELRDEFKYEGDGALVSRVVPDSPADHAGIKKGDVIVGVNSRSVDSPEELARAVRAARVGQNTEVRIIRDGDKKTLNVRLEARPGESDFDVPEPPPVPGEPGTPREPGKHGDLDFGDHDFSFDGPEGGMSAFGSGRGRLGIRIESLNPDLADYFGARDGALVVEVIKDTPAASAGLKAGDVITKVGDQTIHDSQDLVTALRSKEGRVSLTVLRHGTRITREADIGSAPRIRSGDGMMGFRDGDRIHRELRTRDLNGDQDLRRQMQEMRNELKELRKQLEELKR